MIHIYLLILHRNNSFDLLKNASLSPCQHSDFSFIMEQGFPLKFEHFEVILNIENGLAFLINSFIIMTILGVRKLRVMQANVYLCNLFSSYFIRSFVSFLLYAFQDNLLSFGILLELLQAFFVWSSLSLIMVTLDRFLAIRMPFRHQFQTRVTALQRVIGFVWLPTVVYITITLVTKPSRNIVDIKVVSTVLVALAFLTISNTYIFIVVKQHISRHTAIFPSPTPIPSSSSSSSSSSTLPTSSTQSQQRRLRSFTQQIKAAYGCFAFVAIFVMAWSSQCVVLILFLLGRITVIDKFQSMAWSIPLVTLDSFMGPIAYVMFSSEIQKTINSFFLRRIY